MGNPTISNAQREAIRDAIDRLITILDEIEGDRDFEPDADGEDNGDFEREEGT